MGRLAAAEGEDDWPDRASCIGVSTGEWRPELAVLLAWGMGAALLAIPFFKWGPQVSGDEKSRNHSSELPVG